MTLLLLDCFVVPPTNDEFCKLVNFSVFEKGIFSLESRNDGKLATSLRAERSNPVKASRLDCFVVPLRNDVETTNP
jgi:hypothetical protein